MRKEKIIILVFILILIITVGGVSYAAYTYSKTGTKVNSITTGVMVMSYTETSNVINLTGALPTTDKTGKSRTNEGEYFDFTVSSTISGSTNINYEISAKKENGNTIEGRYIKLYLTRLTEDGEEELMTPETYNEESSSNTYTNFYIDTETGVIMARKDVSKALFITTYANYSNRNVQFDVVTDENVTRPDLSEYNVLES